MSEKSLTIKKEDVKNYFELNEQKKVIEQKLKQLKNKFHLAFDDSSGKSKKGVLQRGNYQVQRQIRLSMHYHEENTIQKLIELNLEDFIIIVKRPDTDKLEAAIKLGLVEENAFIDCKKTKVTQAIVVKEAF